MLKKSKENQLYQTIFCRKISFKHITEVLRTHGSVIGFVPGIELKLLKQHDNLSFEEFEALYPRLRDEMGWYGMGHGLDEDFRIYKRDQFNFKDQFKTFALMSSI